MPGAKVILCDASIGCYILAMTLHITFGCTPLAAILIFACSSVLKGIFIPGIG